MPQWKIETYDVELNKAEKIILWVKKKIYEKSKKKNAKGKKFYFMDGPPYATGHIHMGTALNKISKDIIKLREKKYKPGLLCPGSFFKNIIIKDLKSIVRKKLLSKIDNSKIMYGKAPAGYLLEEVGAKGMSSGNVRIAQHHGNLIYNAGGGKARDIRKLSRILKDRVSRKFGVRLEEEVQYL